jgi:hypothetical protein
VYSLAAESVKKKERDEGEYLDARSEFETTYVKKSSSDFLVVDEAMLETCNESSAKKNKACAQKLARGQCKTWREGRKIGGNSRLLI